MQYHPRDTAEIFAKEIQRQTKRDGSVDKLLVDNPWYVVHYFQTKAHKHQEKPGQKPRTDDKPLSDHKRLHSLAEWIAPSESSWQVVDQFLELQFAAMIDLGQSHHIRAYSARLEGKLVHGLGAQHVRESSLTLHPVYGIPYLPSSSIKGVVRNWVLNAFFGGDETKLSSDELSEIQENVRSLMMSIFGIQEVEGRVHFHDVFFPQYSIRPDVLTVHFKDYYEGKRQAATDDQSPVPVSFYSVQDVQGVFYLSVDQSTAGGEELIETAGAWLGKALTELGIGSKTAVGYGWFVDVQDITETRIEAHLMRRQQERVRAQEEARMRAEEEARIRKEREEQERFAALSPGEQLAEQINKLTMCERDQELSKGQFFSELDQLDGEEKVKAAEALKEYWKATGDWYRPSKKQKLKNQVIQEILQARGRV